MASEAQIRANRRNGELSKGPKTVAGKERSAQNALKHGLRSRRLWAIKSEEQDLVNLAERLWACHAPVGPQEETLVKLMIYDLLTLDRIHRVESAVLSPPEAPKRAGATRHPTLIATPTELLEMITRIKTAMETLDPADLERVDQRERDLGLRAAIRLLDEIERGAAQADDETGNPAQSQQPMLAEGVARGPTQTHREARHGPIEETNGGELSRLFEVITPDDGDCAIFADLEKKFTANSQLFNLLMRYRTNSENGYLKKLHELQRLQATRQGESVPLAMAVDVNLNPIGAVGEREP